MQAHVSLPVDVRAVLILHPADHLDLAKGTAIAALVKCQTGNSAANIGAARPGFLRYTCNVHDGGKSKQSCSLSPLTFHASLESPS